MVVSSGIRKIASKGKMRVVGLMSGTSVDGVDVAVVDITKQKVNLLVFDVFPYPNPLRREILRLCGPETALLENICHYNFVLGEVFADAIRGKILGLAPRKMRAHGAPCANLLKDRQQKSPVDSHRGL